MESISGRKKKKKKTSSNENVANVINSLPDEILQHILSFLDTWTAAKSSVLSRRWRYLWIHAPALDFDLDYFMRPRASASHIRLAASLNEPSAAASLNEPSEAASLIHLAASQHKSSTLRRFRMKTDLLGTYMSRKAIGRLLSQLLDFTKIPQVQELHLVFHHLHLRQATFKLPGNILSSGNLRCLELVQCDIGHIGDMDLKKVETLSLSGVDAASEESIALLISSCRGVKRFTYKSCPKVINLDLCLHELRELELGYRGELRHLNIDAPKLHRVELRFEGDDFKLSLKNSLNLQYAVLGQGFHDYYDDICKFKNLVLDLGVARVLELRCPFVEGLLPTLDLFENSSPCRNVKKLVVSISQHASSVVSLLKLFHNLEDLTFECTAEYQSQFKKGGEKLKDMSVHCLKHSLKRVELRNFSDSRNPVKLAKFLVRNAMVLEKMLLIRWNGRFLRNLNLIGLLKESRASKVARIMFT